MDMQKCTQMAAWKGNVTRMKCNTQVSNTKVKLSVVVSANFTNLFRQLSREFSHIWVAYTQSITNCHAKTYIVHP